MLLVSTRKLSEFRSSVDRSIVEMVALQSSAHLLASVQPPNEAEAKTKHKQSSICNKNAEKIKRLVKDSLNPNKYHHHDI